MLESVQNIVLANPLEFYTAVIATFGVLFWVVDRRSMKAALKAAKYSEIGVLRLKRQEIEARVERSLAMLEMKCGATRNIWRNHNWRNGSVFSSVSRVPEEQKEILRVEHEAKSLLNKFKASAPKSDCTEIKELETYFFSADRTSSQIERLALQLPEPQNSLH